MLVVNISVDCGILLNNSNNIFLSSRADNYQNPPIHVFLMAAYTTIQYHSAHLQLRCGKPKIPPIFFFLWSEEGRGIQLSLLQKKNRLKVQDGQTPLECAIAKVKHGVRCQRTSFRPSPSTGAPTSGGCGCESAPTPPPTSSTSRSVASS